MSKKHKRQVSASLANLAARTIEFKPDYSTNKRELKRIAILWGILITALLVLAVFQNQLLSVFLK